MPRHKWADIRYAWQMSQNPNAVPSIEEADAAVHQRADGFFTYIPHDCPIPSTEGVKEGTIWVCYSCGDHWELIDPYMAQQTFEWFRIRRAKYETTSK